MRNDNEMLEELRNRVNTILYPDKIDIEIVGNVAVLRGVVPSLQKRNEAAMAAAYVPGIEGVDNRMIISAPQHIF